MNILSFDTSNNLASAAVSSKGKILAYNITNSGSQQAEKLFELIDLSLKEAKLNINEINLICLSNGPGSFTGVRIAMAAALGLELSGNAKVISLSNFEVIAWHNINYFTNNLPLTVILDAYNEQFYWQSFDKNLIALEEPKIISLNELKSLDINQYNLVGSGLKYLESYDEKLSLANNAKLICQASSFFLDNNKYNQLTPLYIRPPYVC